MASYVSNSLSNGEKINYLATISLWRYWFNFLAGGLLLVGSLYGLLTAALGSRPAGSPMTIPWLIVVVAAVALLLWPFLARKTTELGITDKRVIAKFGLLSTHSTEIRFDKIESVQVQQGLIGRMLKYGDIIVTGTGSTFDPIPNISDPLAFRAALNLAMEGGKPGDA